MKVSNEGIALIKKHEGLRLNAYPDPATGGEPWTIGYGTTSRAGVGPVTKGMKITEAQAEDMLRRALVVFEIGVKNALNRTPTQAQFDALVSFAYNVGVPAMSKSSVVKLYNSGNPEAAADALLKWNKAAGKVMSGLVSRRKAERALFLKAAPPVQEKPAAPIVPPIPAAPDPDADNRIVDNAPPPGHGIVRFVVLAAGAIVAAIVAIFFGGH